MDPKEIDQKIKNAANDLSGVATDIADKARATYERVKEETHFLNNNHAGDSDFNCDAIDGK